MNFIKNYWGKSHTKCIATLVLLAAFLTIIGFEVRILLSGNDLFKPPKECLDKPDGYNTSWSCFKLYFEKITNEVSVEAAMVEARRFKVEKVVSDCHLFAHYIGAAALEKYDFDIGKAFSSCSYGCSKGCLHGVVKEYLSNEDPYKPISEIKNACDDAEKGLLRNECAHGVGHGILYLLLPDAFTVCESFDDEYQLGCFEGLAMENMDQYLSLDLDENNLRKILPDVCSQIVSLKPNMLDLCMYYIVEGILYYTGYDIERTEELCEGLQQQDYIKMCRNKIPEVIYTQQPSNIDPGEFFSKFFSN